MNEEIAAGIRNALDRGKKLSEVVQSFIDAGYSEKEVREAAQGFEETPATPQVPQIPAQKPLPLKPVRSLPPTAPPIMQKTIGYQPKPMPTKKSDSFLTWFLIVILVLLLIGFGLSIIFKDQVVVFLRQILNR